jgi:hypothetical protein
VQRAAAVELALDQACRHAVGVAGVLHDGAARGGLAAHEERNADQPFVSGHGDFRRRPFLGHVEERDDAVDREVDVAKAAARLVDRVAERQRHELEVGREALVIRLGQRGEQAVMPRGVGCDCVGIRRHL